MKPSRVVTYVLAVNVAAIVAAAVARLVMRSSGNATSAEFSRVAILNGDKFASRAPALETGSAMAVMGGVEIDLRDAVAAPGATISTVAVWGGVAIRVPHGWRVEAEGSGVLGDTRFVLDGQEDLAQDAPTVRVQARAIMGGILVTNRHEYTDVGIPG